MAQPERSPAAAPPPGGHAAGEGVRGLDAQGYIAREGSLARVPAVFRPVVAHARDRLLDSFGNRLHSAYLYGSVPRGTARAGRSDLDLLVALREEPTAADRETARVLDAAVDREFPEVDGVDTLVHGRARLLSDDETYDLGWFVACLCTPLLGDDLGEYLPRYRPDARLAAGTNGDLAALLPGWRRRVLAAADAGESEAAVAERRALVRSLSRRLVRTGFTLVMPRWNGWTSDLTEMAEVFGTYYGERAADLRAAARRGSGPDADPAVLRHYVDDLGPWLAAEYARVHGTGRLPPDGRPGPGDGDGPGTA
ncbi:nucleotidyltransferase domain-containing protein [Streptomyces sp. NPDC005840]|uniref:nucleotidyltransferase domain-containing protein n=1 Tax=Streptomyces sp. NPDC005840 TaxID=3157072 RepID=UPI003405ED4B